MFVRFVICSVFANFIDRDEETTGQKFEAVEQWNSMENCTEELPPANRLTLASICDGQISIETITEEKMAQLIPTILTNFLY